MQTYLEIFLFYNFCLLSIITAQNSLVICFNTLFCGYHMTGVPYQLDQLNDTQPKLSAFFAPRRLSNPPVTSSQPETGHSEAEEGISIIAGDSEESRAHVADEIDGVYTEKTTPEMTAQTITHALKSSEVNAETLGNYDKEEKELSSALQSTTNLPSASDNKSSHGKPVAPAAGSSIRRHSTLEDPNFVENYFKVNLYRNIVS